MKGETMTLLLDVEALPRVGRCSDAELDSIVKDRSKALLWRNQETGHWIEIRFTNYGTTHPYEVATYDEHDWPLTFSTYRNWDHVRENEPFFLPKFHIAPRWRGNEYIL
jgi:hypothetical protein